MIVLKDVVVNVLYGVCGVNGVVLIIIKRGKIGKVIIIVDVKWGFNSCGVFEYDVMRDFVIYYIIYW